MTRSERSVKVTRGSACGLAFSRERPARLGLFSAPMPQSARMRIRLVTAILVLFAALPALPQTNPETFQVYTEHPRLFLRPQRLRLLRRERERNSMRWNQFHQLVSGGAPMPEPAFAEALEYRTADDKAAARRAIERASAPNFDLRQTALVFDWCQDELKPEDRRKLVDRLRAGLAQPAKTFADARSQVLAAVALAGEDGGVSSAALQNFIQKEWLGRIIPSLRAGHSVFQGSDTYALYEIFHAIRDNLNADLREDFPKLFTELPLIDLLSYYPAPFPAAENEFHIPYSPNTGEPDLGVAALSRAGELAMVAFDTNAAESQVLQGWLMNDRFLMRGPFGSPYEFMWANPYQPGLSYYHVGRLCRWKTAGIPRRARGSSEPA